MYGVCCSLFIGCCVLVVVFVCCGLNVVRFWDSLCDAWCALVGARWLLRVMC